MHQDLEALLELQADDDVIDELNGKLRALGPRFSELERRRKAIVDQSRGRRGEHRRGRTKTSRTRRSRSPTTSNARSATSRTSTR